MTPGRSSGLNFSVRVSPSRCCGGYCPAPRLAMGRSKRHSLVSPMKSDEIDEIKRHFGVVAEGLQSQFKLAVEALDAKIDVLGRDLVALREETRLGFAETQAMGN